MKYMLLLLAVLLAASVVPAQTKPTPRPMKMKNDAARQLDEMNEKIRVAEEVVKIAEDDLTALREKYSDEYAKVKEGQDRLTKLRESLGQLYVIRERLEKQILVENIPNNQTELLRILVRQNEEIIELLRAIKRNTEN